MTLSKMSLKYQFLRTKLEIGKNLKLSTGELVANKSQLLKCKSLLVGAPNSIFLTKSSQHRSQTKSEPIL